MNWGIEMIILFRRFLMMPLLFLMMISICVSSTADVFINQEKPEDWEERQTLKVIAAETVYNDAFIIQQGSHTMLVDGGAAIVRRRVLRYLQDNGLTEPEIYFNSHPHDDHLEAVWKMIRDGELHPQRFLTPFPREYRNRLHQNTIKALDEHGIPYEMIHNEEEFQLGEARLTMFQYVNGDEPNELSGVLMLRFANATMLLTADLTGEAQKWFANNYGSKLHADILKFPHHGITAMVSDFLMAVNPSFVFVTNRFWGTDKANKQLKKYEIPFMHHSIGTIIMETDGKDWYVEQSKGMI